VEAGRAVVAAAAVLEGVTSAVVGAPTVDDVVVDPLEQAARASTAPSAPTSTRPAMRRTVRTCGSAPGVIGRRA
jgi:hypothetical protein